jgi:hypothetical protein
VISNDGCAPLLINGRMRDEFVNETLFFHIEDARSKIAASVAATAATDRIRPCDSSTPAVLAATLLPIL